VKLRLVFLGKTRGAECRALIDDYVKRIRHFNPVEVVEKKSTHAGLEVLEEARGKSGRGSNVVLPDAAGKSFTSEEFSAWLQKQLNSGKPELIFLLGGAEGFPEETKNAASELLSLSQMTLPHELARVVLAEQLYRGFSILNHHPYSK
jgi:23S rRNA (pseudouridine1915-N3)-methyltransferase